MRSKPNKSVAEARIVKRFHRLHTPIVELVQSLQDLVPEGMELGDKVELTQIDGHIKIAYGARPVELVLNDGKCTFSLKIQELKKK